MESKCGVGSKGFLIFLLVSLLLVVPLGAPFVGGGATAEADDPALTISRVSDLKFGMVVGPGTVVIDPVTGDKKVGGGAIDLGGDHGKAEFLVQGHGKFVITVPTEISIPIEGGGGSVLITDITLSPSNLGTFGPNGVETVFVGGTLQLPPALAASGTYYGDFMVFVDRQ